MHAANLRFHVLDMSENSTVGVYYCPNNDWSETELTYYNSPLQDVKNEASSQVVVDQVNDWHELDEASFFTS